MAQSASPSCTGILDRETNQVVAGVVDSPDAVTLQGRVMAATEPSAQVYTDEATAYAGLATATRNDPAQRGGVRSRASPYQRD